MSEAAAGEAGARARILLVEDNVELAEGIRYNLELEGYDVRVAEDGAGALGAVRAFAPDLVILDVMLPGMDGFQVLRAIRRDGVLVPVMMLTARGEEADQVRAFRLDADQYVTKPFKLFELLERIHMMLRRARALGSPADPGDATHAVLRFGDVEVDTATRTVRKAGRDVALTPKAFDLLLALAAQEGKVTTRQDLLRHVWKHQTEVVTRTVDSHVSELRQKLEDNPDAPRHLLTVWKIGYRLKR
jgi:DNA-binding response OmpR family regulator